MSSRRRLVETLVAFTFLFAALLELPLGAQQGRWEELNVRVRSLYQQGKYSEGIPAAQEALRVAEATFGPEQVNVATSLNNLAELYNAQGKYAQAEPLYKRSLAIVEKALGQDHPVVATSLNSLAELYRAQGKYAEAEPLYKRSLAIREQALGPDHPNVAQSLNNLASLYHAQGRYAEAEPVYKRSLGIVEKALGPNHPNVATGLNNLAELYRAQGKHAEAEPLYKRSLAIREKALGPDHPDVATSLNNLALLYSAQGKYAKAEPLYKRSLGIVEKALGPDHPSVALSLNNLASLYHTQGKYAEAEPLYKRSLAIREKALGPDHPDLAASLNNLAALYYTQGKYAEAEPFYKRSLAIVEKALGPNHPNVATGLNNLAELYRAQGKYAEAEPLEQRSLAIVKKALGPEHPDVATSLNNLALVYEAQGKYAQAEPLYKRSLAIWEKTLGPRHRLVATCLANLATFYRNQGRYTEAEPLYVTALATYEKALGPDHPDVATALNNYSILLRKMDRGPEAEKLEARAKAIRAKNAQDTSVSISHAPLNPGQSPTSEYVNKEDGFHLQLPPGWREIKAPDSMKPKLVVAFQSQDKSLSLAILHAAPLAASPEQVQLGMEERFAKDPSFRKVSEEQAVLSGLPARRLVFDKGLPDQPSHVWFVTVFGQKEGWALMFAAETSPMVAPGSPGYQQFQRILTSFEFLEPVLGRMKGSAAAPISPSVAPANTGGGQSFYINDRIGIKILLPPDWQLMKEEKGSFTQPVTVILGLPGTLAVFFVAREVLEATPEMYKNLVKQRVSKGSQDYRELGEENVAQAGLQGTKLIVSVKANDIRYRLWVLIFSNGKEHFRIGAQAPEEFFDRYQATFEQMLKSVVFPTVTDQSATSSKSESGLRQYMGTGRVTGSPGAEVARLKQKVAQYPDDVGAHMELGNALDDSGSTNAAIDEYKTAIRLNPNSPQPHRNLGVAYFRKAEWKAAEAELRESLRLYPDYLLARWSLAETLVMRDDLKGAFNEYREMIRLDRGQTYHLLLTYLSDLQENPQVEQDFSSAPSEAVAHFYVGLSLLKKKHDRQKAFEQFEEAARIAPNFSAPKQLLAASPK